MTHHRLRIHCPQCGVRAVEEFVYGEIPATPDTLTDPDARDVDRAFMHSNHEGPVAERWFHSFGCRRWFTVRRDTRTNEML
ncbi:MAG TPA: sarcosine oxidase subunit delta [Vicinamibacterales bacterium]|jgi:heterotetrameric sarcosine oxidase delta subunit|nr:sarcosine oxidase subunit delta [Acidobacteriota bacterium]HQX81922.1 sarcosine oxidase subunit delta [Vicinamibacterales bacterium]